MIHTGGKQFNPQAKFIYFIATTPAYNVSCQALNKNVLFAVNELKSAADEALADNFIDRGVNVFVDSGVFNLTNEHARKHNCRMDEALALAPDQIDGFDRLFARYVRICAAVGSRSWGYIEIDQGGRENKILTRTKLEAIGLRPIPVYHPLNDGWDYFDYLAERYDRICFGNIVQASPENRRRLITTAYIRRLKYPHLWIHILGATPNNVTHSCPCTSSDSSTWSGSMRWGSDTDKTFGITTGYFNEDMTYNRQRGRTDYELSKGIHAYNAEFTGRNWRNYETELQSINP